MSALAIATWVDRAVSVAMKSPCQSQRGVIIANAFGRIVADGFNDQPSPFICDQSDACKKHCGKTAIHAEQRALLNTGVALTSCLMLHVKAKDGKPCASMQPSCLECSKLILASGIVWMHLLHDHSAQMLAGTEVVGLVEGFRSDGTVGLLDVRRYSAQHFHYLTAEYFHRIPLQLNVIGGKR